MACNRHDEMAEIIETQEAEMHILSEDLKARQKDIQYLTKRCVAMRSQLQKLVLKDWEVDNDMKERIKEILDGVKD